MSRSIILIIFLALFASNLLAQSEPPKIEVGGQVSIARFRDLYSGTQYDTHKIDVGLGGRFGYNINYHFAIEAQLDFFPQAKNRNFQRPFTGLFGIKGGRRGEKLGFFMKARPGFLNHREPNICASLIVPNAIPCQATFSRTDFALDMGGVLEVYPSKRTLIRVDVGDTLTRMEGVNGHNLQSSIGVGWRF